jgi:predicted DNA-binding protein (UPF0278 family)
MANPQLTDQNFLEDFRRALNESMQKAAEPVIAAALQEVERTMRRRVSEICCDMVQGEIDMLRQRDRS